MPKVKAREFSERRLEWGLVCQDPHLTKQSFKDQCDINRVLDRAKRGASLSHLENYQGEYGDFSDWDENTYQDMLLDISRANSVFYDLPAELRAEYGNNPGKFFSFVNDPANKDRLEEIFPVLAAPGRQLPDVVGGSVGGSEAPSAPSTGGEAPVEAPSSESGSGAVE